VPGESAYINNISYFVPNRSKLNALVKEMFGDYLLSQNNNTQVDIDDKKKTNTKNNNTNNNNKNNNTNKNNTNKNNKKNNNR